MGFPIIPFLYRTTVNLQKIVFFSSLMPEMKKNQIVRFLEFSIKGQFKI